MTSQALEFRCAELRQPVLNLVETGIAASMKPSDAPLLVERIDAVRGVLAQGTDGIEEESYLEWHPTGLDTLRNMDTAARSGNTVAAWAIFKDPVTGFNGLGQACAGCRGW
jgi:hypothetical protein